VDEFEQCVVLAEKAETQDNIMRPVDSPATPWQVIDYSSIQIPAVKKVVPMAAKPATTYQPKSILKNAGGNRQFTRTAVQEPAVTAAPKLTNNGGNRPHSGPYTQQSKGPQAPRNPVANSAGPTCYACGQVGHIAARCPNRAGAKEALMIQYNCTEEMADMVLMLNAMDLEETESEVGEQPDQASVTLNLDSNESDDESKN
jgi:hypothetical protein